MSNQQNALRLALEALELALSSHGVMLLSDPPQDPWKTKGVESKSRQAITAIKEALAQPAQEIDWKDQYEYQKRRAEMWIAKYEKDIGPLEKVFLAAQPAQEPISDVTEAVTRTVIDVEKLLCEKLGKKWQASGMSIQTLVDELAAQPAQPAQEPVAMRYEYDGYGYKYIDSGSGSDWQTRIKDAEPIYTTPPQRPWVGLTDEEIRECFAHVEGVTVSEAVILISVVRTTQASLKEKNT